jgi:hypothetical protein
MVRRSRPICRGTLTRTPGDKPLLLVVLVRVFYFSSTNNAISRDDIIGLEKVLKNAAANAESFKYVRRSTVQGLGKVES